jgi:hypothetical protein
LTVLKRKTHKLPQNQKSGTKPKNKALVNSSFTRAYISG